MSAVTVGELRYGALKSARPDSNLARIDALAAAVPTVAIDGETAALYAAMRNHARQVGKPIGDNDLWIAATARQHGLSLVTRDADFESLPELSRERW